MAPPLTTVAPARPRRSRPAGPLRAGAARVGPGGHRQGRPRARAELRRRRARPPDGRDRRVLDGAERLSGEVVGCGAGTVTCVPFGDCPRSARRRPCRRVRARPVGAGRPAAARPGDRRARPTARRRATVDRSGDGRHRRDAASPAPSGPRRHADVAGRRVWDTLVPMGKGQRVGVFAGSGVGKSTLMGMVARGSTADVNVVALIGERGREVREFIESELGDEGLGARWWWSRRRTRRRWSASVRAARDPARRVVPRRGADVVLMMDSLTRYCMAQREIGLSAGEPPTSRGYPPSVFSMLPRLLERAGTGETGSITGLYTVLVDGDDHNEPIADAARSILDGHVVLSRALAHAGHYPAIDALASVSRVATAVTASGTRRSPRAPRAAGRLRRGPRPHRDRRLRPGDEPARRPGGRLASTDRGVPSPTRRRPDGRRRLVRRAGRRSSRRRLRRRPARWRSGRRRSDAMSSSRLHKVVRVRQLQERVARAAVLARRQAAAEAVAPPIVEPFGSSTSWRPSPRRTPRPRRPAAPARWWRPGGARRR